MASVLTRLLLLDCWARRGREQPGLRGYPPGKYECWFYSTPQPLQNFSLGTAVIPTPRA